MLRAFSTLILAFGASVAPARAAPPQDADGAAFIEVHVERQELYLHEPLRLRVRFGFEESLLAERLVPLFRRQLDLSVQLRAAWLDALPGTRPLAADASRTPPPGGPTFALEDEVVHASRLADRVTGGRTYKVFGFERTVLVDRVGALEVPAAQLRFAYATRFEEDFTGGLIPVGRAEETVSSLPLTLSVKALPEDGRPAAFRGAVGDFLIDARATPTRLALGESCALTVRIEGPGNLELAPTPELDRFSEFDVLGVREVRAPRSLELVYDLAPRHARVREVPALTFAYFDPAPPAGFRTLATRPIALQVSAAATPPQVEQGPGIEGDAPDHPARPASGADAPTPLGPWIAGALGGLIAGLLWVGLGRRSGGRDPSPARVRRAAQAYRTAPTGRTPDQALGTFLADCVEQSSGALVGADVVGRLATGGIEPGEAARAAGLLEEANEVRYGGRPSGDLVQRIDDLVDDWARRAAK